MATDLVLDDTDRLGAACVACLLPHAIMVETGVAAVDPGLALA
jgi:hypothetical protein